MFRYFRQIVLIALLLACMAWCHDPRAFGDRQKAVKAIRRYHETQGTWPTDLKAVKEKVKDIRFKYDYHYRNAGESFFTLSYSGGLNDKSALYDSRTGEWEDQQD